MGFRLREIELTAAGREIVRDRDVDKPGLTVGRAAENDIHLPDLAVEPHHASITAIDDSRVEVASLGTLAFTLDGGDTHAATIDSRGGAELGFGIYRLTVSQDADGAILVTIRQTAAAATRSGDLEEKRGFSLAGVLPGKRIMAWGLALVILAAFLAVPVTSYLVRDAEAGDSVVGDGSWSTGDLSLAHHGLEDQCESCHVSAFESVRDETCLTCHEDIGDHAAHPRMAASRQGGPRGERILWSVAHTFGKEGPGSCADCHVEHEGKTRMTPPSQAFCADCHTDLRANLPDTRLGNAGDFGKLHPQFTPAVVTDAASRKLTRVSLDGNPRENHGLAFPHKLHLDPGGGVARMAANIGSERGYAAGGMQCKDCHRPTEDGVRFKPIEMERDCEACHSLAYDKVGGIFRRLRHGDVDQLIADLNAADRSRPPPGSRRRPGEYAEGGRYHFPFSARNWNALTVSAALSKDGVCGDCHTPAFRDGKPGVMPVTLVSRYMHHGWFDHRAHKQEDCTSCHAAGSSASASDVLLPDLKQCRTCHLGEASSEADVPSSCAMCHTYHPPEQSPAPGKLAVGPD